MGSPEENKVKKDVSFGEKQPSWSKVHITMILTVLAVFTIGLIGSGQSVSSPPSNINRPVDISGVKFTIPKNFRLEQFSHSGIAFLRHEKDDLALFVAVSKNQQVSDGYLTDLSNEVVSQLLPQQERFMWRISRHSGPKISVHESARGTIKGLNSRKYVQTDFVVVKAQQQEIVVGSISVFGTEKDARHLFDVEGYEYSFTGWEGLFQLIASVTGEKYNRGN
jgi:hypothetical protein